MPILDLRSEQKPSGPDPKCGKVVAGKLAIRDPGEGQQ